MSPARQPLDATPRGGTGSNGSGSGRGNRDSHDNRDNGGGGDGSVGDRGTGAAASHTQTPSISTSGLLYGSTSTINAATAAVGGAGSTRVAEGGVGGGELMERFGSGGAPVTCLGSHDSAEDRGGIRGRGLNSLGEGSGAHDHVRDVLLVWVALMYRVILQSLIVRSCSFSFLGIYCSRVRWRAPSP